MSYSLFYYIEDEVQNFQLIIFKGFLCNSQSIGFRFVGFAVELEYYPFVFNPFAVNFKPCFQGKWLDGLFDSAI